MKRTLSIAAIAVGLTLGVGVGGANAAVEYPDWGRWEYGSASGGTWGSGTTIYSYYDHWWKKHRATACGGPQDESCVRSDWEAPYTTARAEARDWYGQNRAYWATLG